MSHGALNLGYLLILKTAHELDITLTYRYGN